MKIAVCVKQVPTREWQPRLDREGTWILEQDASFELNEPDAYALEAALRLRDQHGGEVVACTVGPTRAQQVLREALARGADRALHVDAAARATVDPFVTARLLADAMAADAFDLVLTGLQSDDVGHGSTGVALAEFLGLPHATIVMDVQVEGATVRVKRELEGGWFQWVRMPLPALVTVQSGINQLRYATLKGIMAAKKKELRHVTPAQPLAPVVEVQRVSVPTSGKQTTMIGGTPGEAAAELVRRLRDEARVL